MTRRALTQGVLRKEGTSRAWKIGRRGLYPRRSRDGRELFFLSGTNWGNRGQNDAPVKKGSSFEAGTSEAGTPKPLFDANVLYGIGLRQGVRDAALDGRFLINAPVRRDANESITAVLNWQANLKK